jgi:hypothetical protein
MVLFASFNCSSRLNGGISLRGGRLCLVVSDTMSAAVYTADVIQLILA